MLTFNSWIWLEGNTWLLWVVQHLPFLSIPLVSGLVGWFTNVLALKMTFYPLEYRGLGPIGWQGIIPSKAPKMASLSVDLMTTKLVNVVEIFEHLDPEVVALKMRSSLELVSRQIIDEIIDAQAPMPSLWHKLPESSREAIYQRAADKLPDMMQEMMDEMKHDIKSLLDLKALAIDTLVEDKNLINQIFLGVGKKEFIFIERSGFYFGFLFGLAQMLIFYFYNPWWTLPAAGLLVGYLTNWLALFLIFNPIKERRFFGIRFQGLFVKRQQAVAFEYARIIAERILTIDALFDYLLRGPSPSAIREIVRRQVSGIVDDYMGAFRPYIEKVLGIHRIDVVKNIVHYRLMEELPVAIRDIFEYAERQLNIEHTLATKMAALSEVEFVEFLRPVFQEDELKLILVGAALGGIAGLLQYFLLFA